MKYTLQLTALLIFFSIYSSAQTGPARFENTIQEYEKEDQQNGYHPESILFVGSSSFTLWKTLSEDMSPVPVINRGFGGSTIPDVLYFADRIILPQQPKIIVFYCGENDLSSNELSVKGGVQNFKAFHKYLRKNLPETKLYFISIKPSIRREALWPKFQEANKELKKFMRKHKNYYFVDTASSMLDENGKVYQDIFLEDNLHMNAKGYAIWIDIIKPLLLPYF